MVDLDALERAGMFARAPQAAAPVQPHFYHVMHVPGQGEVGGSGGSWDLRSRLDVYLGRTTYAGQAVLDIGAADGFVAFELEKRGARVVSVDLPADSLPDLFPLAGGTSHAPGTPNLVPRIREAFWPGATGGGLRISRRVRGRCGPAEAVSPGDVGADPQRKQDLAAGVRRARRQMAILRNRVPEIFARVDLLVTPTTMQMPPTIASVTSDPSDIGLIRNTVPFNVLGIPTISIPCGFSRAGLPIGLQISGPRLGEARVLALAHAYERATEWHRRAPAV